MAIEIVKMKECPYFGWQSLANQNTGKQNLRFSLLRQNMDCLLFWLFLEMTHFGFWKSLKVIFKTSLKLPFSELCPYLTKMKKLFGLAVALKPQLYLHPTSTNFQFLSPSLRIRSFLCFACLSSMITSLQALPIVIHCSFDRYSLALLGTWIPSKKFSTQCSFLSFPFYL